MNLPAGIIPSDANIELFGKEFGRCYFIQNGKTKVFAELPDCVFVKLENELEKDVNAIKAMCKMGIDEEDFLEQYNYCNRSKLDGVTDISTSGKLTREHVDCDRRNYCTGEGIVCKHIIVNGNKITPRERECLEHVSSGKSYKQIKEAMGFGSQASVNSIMERLRNKLEVSRVPEMILKAQQIGII